jgi:hypothetical protein
VSTPTRFPVLRATRALVLGVALDPGMNLAPVQVEHAHGRCLPHERRMELTLSRPCSWPRPNIKSKTPWGDLRATAKRIAAPRREERAEGVPKEVVAAMEAVARALGLVLVVLVALVLLLPALGLVALVALAQAWVRQTDQEERTRSGGGSVPKRSISPSRR